MKQKVTVNEKTLNEIIKESIKRVLNEKKERDPNLCKVRFTTIDNFSKTILIDRETVNKMFSMRNLFDAIYYDIMSFMKTGTSGGHILDDRQCSVLTNMMQNHGKIVRIKENSSDYNDVWDGNSKAEYMRLNGIRNC